MAEERLAEAGNAPAISIRGLAKSYGQTVALNGVSLDVACGEVFGYIGPNGAGKTTTIKIVTGLVAPDAGSVTVAGFDVRREALDAKGRIGYVPESGAVYEKFSASEYLTLTGRLYGMTEARVVEAVDRWLAFFGLDGLRKEPMGRLSKGQKQRVCWAAALLHEPRVLVLDEPLNGLDVETVAKVKQLMSDLAACGRTVLYSSHLMDVVTRVCHRLAVLHRGRLVTQGTVSEVTASLNAVDLEQGLIGLAHPPPEP